jgi:hypothetical protein
LAPYRSSYQAAGREADSVSRQILKLLLIHIRSTIFVEILRPVIAATAGRYIVFFNDDAIAEEGWLSAIVDAFEHSPPSIAVIGGPVHPIWEGQLTMSPTHSPLSIGNNRKKLYPRFAKNG